MKKDNTLRLSITLNVVFACLLIILIFKFKEVLFESKGDVDENISIVMFGDSITDDGDWSSLLGRNDVKKRGFRGFTTSQYRWIIMDSVLNYKPEICFISGGINDFGCGIPLKRTKLNYKILLETMLENNVKPVVQSTLYQENNPKSKVLVDSLNSYLIEYCNLNEIQFLDINSKLSSKKGLKPEFSRDGTHLTKAAYQIWGKELALLLKQH